VVVGLDDLHPSTLLGLLALGFVIMHYPTLFFGVNNNIKK
jgi:hypothetical protein